MGGTGTAINALNAELNEKLAELKKAEAAAQKIGRLRSDINALQRSLSILKKEEPPPSQHHLLPPGVFPHPGVLIRDSGPLPPPLHLPPTRTPDLFRRETSIPEMVEAILREAGKPMASDEIMNALLTKDKNLNKPSVMGAIYRNAKVGRLFKLVKPGVFGLLEWALAQEGAKKEFAG